MGLPKNFLALANSLHRPRQFPEISARTKLEFASGVRTVGGTLRDRPLAATASHTSTVDDIALLGLVAETTSLVGARRTGSTVDGIELTELY